MRRDKHSDRRRIRQYVTAIMQMATESDSWETWDRDLEILSTVAKSRGARTLILRPASSLKEQRDGLDEVIGNIVSAEGSAPESSSAG